MNNKEYYEKNKVSFARKNKSYRDKNKEKIAIKSAEYRLKNKDKIKEYSAKRYAENKDKILARFKKGKYYQSKLKGDNNLVGSKTAELWKNPEYRKMMSDAHKGNKGYWKDKKIPEYAKEKMRQSKLQKPTKYWLNKKCPHSAGENNPGYIHGKHPEHKRQRRSMEYARWRREVFKRDDWTCVFCNKKGVKLHADHIKPFAIYEELRFDINNGRTLCVECHRKTDTYGSKTQLLIKGLIINK